jgi:hypothetical protein
VPDELLNPFLQIFTGLELQKFWRGITIDAGLSRSGTLQEAHCNI